jgi:hypothetical protein
LKYLSPESFPDDIRLCEPSKLQLSVITRLWNHWRQKQQAGDHGLVFIHAKEQDVREAFGKGKGKDKGKGKAPPRWFENENDITPSSAGPLAGPLAGPSGHRNSPEQHETPDGSSGMSFFIHIFITL